ncbi:MAG: hypothetical protein SRB2_04475 [Desulfobacteraceae bacterium Eth-SRB2]|nr:MAG: hypothetical protein SRB2_04475 [Desulfobacteraceae bacterium Eth-SRB2]
MEHTYRQTSRIHRVIFIGIIFLLVFAPLAFGSVHVWAYSVVEIGVYLLLILWFVDRLMVSRSDSVEWVKTLVNLILVAFLVLVSLQMLPLPASVVALVSPQAFADKGNLFALLGGSGDGPGWTTFSYSVHPTRNEWIKAGTYFGMFFLVLNTVKSKKEIDILVYTLIFIGLFEAVYAIFQVFNVTPRVWWWKSRVGNSRWASGTFIVSNHFAAYMEMVLCLTFGFLIAQKRRTREMLPGLGSTRARVQRFVSWFSPESVRPKMIFFFFVAVFMGVALLLSASRGGILSIGVTMLLTAILFLSKKTHRKYGGLALCLCVAILFYGIHVGIDPTFDKFENPNNLYGRLHITRTILPMIRDYPVSGVGLGNFRYVYPRYIDDYDRVSSSGYAHNDWVEAGTETGFPGLLLIFLAFVIYIVRMTRIWHRRRNLHALGIGAGVMAGLLSVGMHSYFDFNMHIPANPLTLAALLAIGYAAVHRQGHGDSESFFYHKRKIPLTRFRRFAILGLVLFVSGFAVCSTGKHFLAEAACPTEWNSTMNLTWDPELSDIDRAIALDAGNFEYHYKRAEHLLSLNKENKKDGNAFNLEAQKSLEQAVCRNPASGTLWFNLGKTYSSNKYDLFDYLNKWLPLADDCFDAGIKYAPMDEHILFNVAWYWVWRARLLPERKEEGKKIRRKDEGKMNIEHRTSNVQHRPSEIENKFHGVKMMNKKKGGVGDKGDKSSTLFREEGIRKFQEYFQRALALAPQNWEKAVQRTWAYFPDNAVVLGIVPESNKALKSLALKFLAESESSKD